MLHVISSSPGELEPVFQALLANAVRICEAKFGTLLLFEEDELRLVAMHGAPRRARQNFDGATPQFRSMFARLVETRQIGPHCRHRGRRAYASILLLVELAGARSFMLVPMLKGNELIGAITIYRQDVGRSRTSRSSWSRTLPHQAVIAIENTRLLKELRQRTDDLSESLEQQTATSEVLRVISSSPGKLEPVFQAMLANAVRVFGAKFGTMYLRQGDCFASAPCTVRRPPMSRRRGQSPCSAWRRDSPWSRRPDQAGDARPRPLG